MQKLKLYRQFDQIMNQLNPTDLYRTPHPTTANYAFFFSNAHGSFTRTDYAEPQIRSRQISKDQNHSTVYILTTMQLN